MNNESQYCTFYLDKYFFGVEVSRIQEVLRYQEMTSIPLAPSVIRGLINLRGQIVTAIDLRRKLDFEELPEEKLPMNVVIRADEGAVSFLVDEIGDVLNVDEISFEPPPATVTGPTRELVKGVYKLENRLLLILDIDKVLN